MLASEDPRQVLRVDLSIMGRCISCAGLVFTAWDKPMWVVPLPPSLPPRSVWICSCSLGLLYISGEAFRQSGKQPRALDSPSAASPAHCPSGPEFPCLPMRPHRPHSEMRKIQCHVMSFRLLRTHVCCVCSVPGTVPGAGDTAMSQAEGGPTL